jgi:thioredoxin reductase (NADPH)
MGGCTKFVGCDRIKLVGSNEFFSLKDMAEVWDVVILGSGPAGLTAALYTARAQHQPLVFVGPELGGQVARTYIVENYPGFKDGPSGPELTEALRTHAEKFGAQLIHETVQEVSFSNQPFFLKTDRGEYWAKTVVVATGAYPRKLNIPGEAELTGRGVSYCAVCDGAFFKDREVIVVGGGDSALDEGYFLTKFAKRVRIVHRREKFRAEKIYIERAKESPKIEFILNTVVTEIVGDDKVEGAKIYNSRNDKKGELHCDGVFIYIGQVPNTKIFKGKLRMDEKGFLVVDERMRTSVSGVFAAGECVDWRYKQIVTAAGDGCRTALEAEAFLIEEGQ